MSAQPLTVVPDGVTGEVREFSPAEAKARIIELQDHVRGLERNLAGWAHRCAELERDKLAEAQTSQLWPLAVQWHEHHQRVTGRRSTFKLDTYEKAEPFLKAYGIEVCLAASEGIAFDHYISDRKNGTKNHHTTWKVLLGSTERFEEALNAAPLDVLARLKADGLLPGWKRKRQDQREKQTTMLDA
jgi:hypothetical protein